LELEEKFKEQFYISDEECLASILDADLKLRYKTDIVKVLIGLIGNIRLKSESVTLLLRDYAYEDVLDKLIENGRKWSRKS